MTKRAAIYARVSTDTQTSENQLIELRRIASINGWEIAQEFVDEGISGAKGRDKRPQFDALLKGAVRKDFDVVMSWSVDRLGPLNGGRSVRPLRMPVRGRGRDGKLESKGLHHADHGAEFRIAIRAERLVEAFAG